MFRLEWLGLGFLVIVTLTSSVPCEAPPPTEQMIACPARSTRVPVIDVGPVVNTISTEGERDQLRDADRLYRAGAAGEAARSMRAYVDVRYSHPTPRATELSSLAELYAQFAEASATIARATSPIERFVALRRAQSLDLALGGAFTERLNAQMREVAPLAAAAYARVHDTAGAELATHTATLFR